MKQPRVPEYRESEGVPKYIKALTLFLKDFSQDVWTANRNAGKTAIKIDYPVTSVNSKTGDVTLDAGDVGALPSDGTAADSAKLGGKTWAERLLDAYPVGSIYLSTDSTSPAGLFGGTWEQLKDRFLLGAGGSYALGSTGGEATHKLTSDEMPNHVHTYAGFPMGESYTWEAPNMRVAYIYTKANPYPTNVISSATGGSKAHNTLPPYLAVNVWKRVS